MQKRYFLPVALVLSATACTSEPPQIVPPAGATPPVSYSAPAAAAEKASTTEVTPRSPRAWALATTALLFEVNDDRNDLLPGRVATPESKEWGKRLLSSAWGVGNSSELVETLAWLEFKGHRDEFATLGRQVDAMADPQFMAAQSALANEPDAQNRLRLVRQNYHRLGEKSILGWDLIRYIALCRWGYLTGYLSEADAWNRIMITALRLQQTFGSWQELEENYLIGRQF